MPTTISRYGCHDILNERLRIGDVAEVEVIARAAPGLLHGDITVNEESGNDQPETAPAPRRKKTAASGIFAIDVAAWEALSSYSLFVRVAYLILASGTGGNNRTTWWSIKAITTWTPLTRGQAKAALDTLKRVGAITEKDRRGGNPCWRLEPAPWGEPADLEEQPARIWLPCSLTTGVAKEKPPLRLLLEARNQDALTLLIHLYHQQYLPEHGGIPRDVLRVDYKCKDLGSRAHFRILGANAVGNLIQPGPVAGEPFMTGRSIKGQDEGWPKFWAAYRCLEGLGLLGVVPYLFDGTGQDAFPILPVPPDWDTLPQRLERAIGGKMREVGEALLDRALRTEKRKLAARQDCDLIIPVPPHLTQPTLIGIYRLRYLAETERVKWWRDDLQKLQAEVDRWNLDG